ncbi:MAG: phage head closure protein [Pseudomonadota bacterium]
MPSDDAPLRHRLTLEARSAGPDAAGGWIETWTPIAVHFAAIRPASGAEVRAGSAQAQRVTHRLILRASPEAGGVRPRADQRFRGGDRLFDIKAVFERDGRGRLLTCLCEEVALGAEAAS